MSTATAQPPSTDAAGAKALAEKGAILLDVRSAEEWGEGHAKGAVWIPWQEVPAQAPRKLPKKDAAIVTYCASGARAERAARTLRELGYTNVTTMSGGFADLRKLGYPAQ